MSEPTNASHDEVRSGELDLDAIESRAQAATPGPFRIGSDFVGKRYVETNSGDLIAGSVSWEDAPHIAGMDPETTLALVAEVRRLRALVESVRDTANEWLALAEAPEDPACPDGTCGTCTMGNSAQSLLFTLDGIPAREPSPS